MVVAPLAIVIIMPTAAFLMGAFENFQWVGKNVTALEAFGILGTMCFPFCAFFFARMKWDQVQARDSKASPTAAGVIHSSRVERRLTKSGMHYCLDVRYAYQFGGRTYQGETLAFAPRWFSDEARVEQLALKYRANAAVDVHVDPSAPDNAVLDTSEDLARQADWRIWVSLSAPLIAALVVGLRNLPG